MNLDVVCACGRVLEATLLTPRFGNDGEYDPYTLSRANEGFDDGEVQSELGDSYARMDGYITCECGSRFHVAVNIEVEQKRAPMSDDAVGGHVDIGVLFSGRQIHATDSGGDWPEQTYLYQDGELFWFEQDNPGGTRSTVHSKAHLKEYVAKLLPILFTPEEVEQLVPFAKE